MWPLLLLSTLITVGANSLACPTNVTCFEKETCCETSTGLWACCPIQDGLCCDDGLHCCAKNQKCLPNGKCSSATNEISLAALLHRPKIQLTDVPCPDGSSCPDGNTCCQLASGQYGCCPLADAVCCSDHLHCCPSGYTCDVEHSRCKKQIDEPKDVPCPGGSSSCPDGETCCQLQSGDYGCCPLPDAVCCSDHLHCCPNGYTCDVEHSRCKKQIDELNDVPCPGGSSACPDGETCCQLQSGDYGCCPLPDAVCCSDHLHCCPHGYTCDVEKGQCIKGLVIPWFKKQPAIRSQQNFVNINKEEENLININVLSNINKVITCADGLTECQSTSTCCLTAEGSYGCCPIQEANCCHDQIHCCPKHYQCDLHGLKCDHAVHGSIDLIRKEKPLKAPSKLISESNQYSSLSTIQCPDGTSFCPEETTCCELENGSYGCCPYVEATCCSDKVHCCGNGYSCDDSGKRCIRHLSSSNNKTEVIPSSIKFQSLKLVKHFGELSQIEDAQCPDGKTKCSPTTTCCPNKQNGEITYSCCPYSKGVCCGNNGSVCCPNGYVCNEEQLSCQLNYSKLNRSLKLDFDYNQCGSSDLSCSSSQTCCRTYGSSDGEYACCAFPDAQCCEDGRHCCPKGTTCDIQYGGCIQDL